MFLAAHRLFTLVVLSWSIAPMAACSARTVDATSKRAAPVPVVKQVSPAPVVAQEKPVRRLDFSPERYLSHIAFLAHDELGGRGTGSDGIDLAAGYVAGQFAADGLLPGGPNGTYFQEFTISRGAELLDKTDLTITGADIDAELYTDFIPFGFSTQGDFQGELVFAGYGITNPQEDHDDYAGLDVTGKVVLMLRREPPAFEADGYTDHARFDRKLRLAAEHGAVAVLVVNQDPGEDGIDNLMKFRARNAHEDIAAMHIRRELADEILKAGSAPSLLELQRRLDETGENASTPLGGLRASGTVAYESKDLLARNVIGVLPGTGPDAEQYLVIGAHYDHLGIKHERIFNGADDNASGTAGVLELAHAFAATPSRNRSLIFIAFTGEEIGLYGSRHFVEDPTVPLDSIVAMLNLDMIGRMDPTNQENMLSIQGVGTGASFAEILAQHAEELDIDYLADQGMFGGSDHMPFHDAGIPAIFFFTGIHPDYHQPSDDTEKINAKGAVQIVQLALDTAKDVLNTPEVPQFVSVEPQERSPRGMGASGGVVMGIMPDTQDESGKEGWRVARVLPNSGAFKAGMKGDDRIIAIDGQPISGLSDYRKATADKQPGDLITITVLRGGEKLELQVELSARGRRG